MKSPWDDPQDELTPDVATADDLPGAPATLAEESETWRKRSHQLWNQARADGDLRAQASALNSAFRGLRDQADTDAAKAASSTQTGVPEEVRQEIERACLDGVVAATEDFYRKHRTLCPTCHGQGDRLRIQRFEKWLAEQDGRTADFAAWNAKTPYAMSGTLEEKGGFYLDDEISTSNTPN